MPEYLFENPKTKKIISVIQGMKDEHVYFEDRIKFNRVFQVPQAAMDIKVNPFDKKKFIEKTGQTGSKGGKIGDLYNRSADLSAARADKAGGIDPLKLSYAHEYQKSRKGKKLPVKNGNQYYADRI